jgi:hypothetical protein
MVQEISKGIARFMEGEYTKAVEPGHRLQCLSDHHPRYKDVGWQGTVQGDFVKM